ncbi:hypothetical protein B0H63DRAFT_528505 [Podospora didyma]|uniref:RRM domain-containing protein n=1 Tax=Podospora didyma TaxID=330526 RepID=A0AAE0K205_9PEZI|nr:hypothetical protein B0H63DRAFT_528505 [Podospora didyma]
MSSVCGQVRQKKFPVSVTVPPAKETDIFYIPLAGLPHRTSPQELKRFVTETSQCEIDCVELYPPTGAWVRVYGEDSYEKVFKAINGVTLRHKCLLAFPNAKEKPTTIMVMDTNTTATRVPPIASSARSEAPAASTKNPNTSRTSVVGSYAGYSTDSSAAHTSSQPPFSSTTYGPGVVSSEYPYSPGHSTLYHGYADSTASDGSLYGYSPAATHSPAITQCSNPYSENQGDASFTASQYGYGVSDAYGSYSSGASYGAATPYGYTDYMPSDPGQAAGYQSDNQYFATEKRKVYIGNLNFSSVSNKKLRACIADYVSTDIEKQIEQIYIPPAENGKPRGYAIVSFRDVGAAQATVQALHNRTVDKRALTVHFATEGVPTTNTGAALVQFREQRRMDRSAERAQEKSARRQQRATAIAKSTSQAPPPPPPPTPVPAKPAIAFGSWGPKKQGSGSSENPWKPSSGRS